MWLLYYDKNGNDNDIVIVFEVWITKGLYSNRKFDRWPIGKTRRMESIMYTIHGYKDFKKETIEETIEAFANLGVMIEAVSRESTIIPWYNISIGHYPYQKYYKMVNNFDEAVEVANKILDEEIEI